MKSDESVARGYFWLGDPEAAIAGELRHSPLEGATLSLFGDLENGRILKSDFPIRYAAVHGHTEDLGWVHLLDVLVVTQHFGMRPTTSELHSNLMICSSAANDYTAAPILRITAEIDCLHEWVGVSGFSHDYSDNFKSVQVSFRSPDAIEFDVPFGQLAFAFARTGPQMRVIQKESTIAQTTYIRISFNQPVSIKKYREYILAIRDLISFAIGRSLSWKSVEAEFEVVSTQLGGTWAKIMDRTVGKPCADVLHPHEMLFSFSDVRSRFDQVLNAWVKIREELMPLCTLYSATTRGQTIYAEHRLFNFFQALESYHRTRYELDETAKQSAQAIREKMLGACTNEEQTWARDKLQHLGEPSAAQRLTDLIEKFHGHWIFEPDWKESVRRIKNLRNYFTHYSKKPPSENLDPGSISNDGSRLQVLCEQILLVELGFSASEAVSLLQQKRRLEQLTVR